MLAAAAGTSLLKSPVIKFKRQKKKEQKKGKEGEGQTKKKSKTRTGCGDQNNIETDLKSINLFLCGTS